MKHLDVIKELKAWLKKPGNSTVIIATAMDYKSSTTINKWIENKRIPHHQVSRLLEIIRKDQTNGIAI